MVVFKREPLQLAVHGAKAWRQAPGFCPVLGVRLPLAGAVREALGERAVRRSASGGPEVWPERPPVAQRPIATARAP
jgi:hypothetical protein